MCGWVPTEHPDTFGDILICSSNSGLEEEEEKGTTIELEEGSIYW